MALGQADTTSNTTATTRTRMTAPIGLAFDASDRLFVVESANNRTLVFAPPFSTNMNASLVIGQPDFTTNTETDPPTARKSVWTPSHPAISQSEFR